MTGNFGLATAGSAALVPMSLDENAADQTLCSKKISTTRTNDIECIFDERTFWYHAEKERQNKERKFRVEKHQKVLKKLKYCMLVANGSYQEWLAI